MRHKPIGPEGTRRFAKSVLGICSDPGTSVYALACRAMANLGWPPTSGTAKQQVYASARLIQQHMAGITAASKLIAAPTPSAARPPKRPKTPRAATRAREPYSGGLLFADRHGVNPASDAFLSTYEWKKMRMQALKMHGARCQCCGATPATGAVMNVDHIKPRKVFPEMALSLDNLQVLCGDCNHGKGNWDMTDWREPSAQSTGAPF